MDNQESSRFPAPLETPGAVAGGARQIGNAIDAHWMDVVAALEPIVGQGGVAALFRHAVCRSALQHPWLAALLGDDGETAGLNRLSEVFSAQSPEAASAAGSVLFDAFGETLVSLLGAPLGTRLLQPSGPVHPTGHPLLMNPDKGGSAVIPVTHCREAHRTAKARADLAAVLADLSQAQEQLGSHRVHQLLAANEQLVIDALRSRALAEVSAERVSELTRSTEFDALTGLPNRLLLFDRLDQALTHAKRRDGKLALMFIDLDGFKLINDTLGHKVGDAVLRAVGHCLNECVRQVDTVCRLGGDEFVVLLTEITQAADSTLVAEKLLASLAQFAQVDGVPVQVSASIGISVFPDDATALDALVDCADKAMYRCKRSGGGCHYFFSAPDSAHDALYDASEVVGSPSESEGREEDRDQRLSAMQASVARQEVELSALRRASANKDEFLSVLGHELRNPLAPVITTLHLMRLRADGKETIEHSTIRRHLSHLIRLVDDLQDVAKIATGKVDLRLRPAPINDAVLEAIAVAKPLLEERQQKFILEAAPETITCMVDPARLEQCVANLLINATKYTPPRGTITLSTRREGETAVIAVADNGRGISTDALPRVFDLFFQERSDVKQHEPGLGVGLALVHSLIGLHSGTVSVHSDGLGRGSAFVIRLPVVASGDMPPPQPASARWWWT